MLTVTTIHVMYNTFFLIIRKTPANSSFPGKTNSFCFFVYFLEAKMNHDRGQNRSTGRQRWLTDFLLPEDTSTPKRWFLWDDEWVWIYKQWSQLYALLTRDGGKTSEAVSGSTAIKPTQGPCSLLLRAHHPNTGFFCISDQTNEIFLKY